jgi:hypothetical protein
VNVTAIRSPLASIDFITLKIKDAVCDRFRMETGKRPSVDTAHPAVRIHAFLTTDSCTFYLDTSGEALFKRGYRGDALAAPLRENLAAGMLALAGWRADRVLLDPFCGSGTILIEAAMIALRCRARPEARVRIRAPFMVRRRRMERAPRSGKPAGRIRPEFGFCGLVRRRPGGRRNRRGGGQHRGDGFRTD